VTSEITAAVTTGVGSAIASVWALMSAIPWWMWTTIIVVTSVGLIDAIRDELLGRLTFFFEDIEAEDKSPELFSPPVAGVIGLVLAAWQYGADKFFLFQIVIALLGFLVGTFGGAAVFGIMRMVTRPFWWFRAIGDPSERARQRARIGLIPFKSALDYLHTSGKCPEDAELYKHNLITLAYALGANRHQFTFLIRYSMANIAAEIRSPEGVLDKSKLICGLRIAEKKLIQPSDGSGYDDYTTYDPDEKLRQKMQSLISELDKNKILTSCPSQLDTTPERASASPT
jgi:hypothetical protein